MNEAKPLYVVRQSESDQTWCVIDCASGKVAVLDEVPQNSMSEQDAREIAALLNDMTDDGSRI